MSILNADSKISVILNLKRYSTVDSKFSKWYIKNAVLWGTVRTRCKNRTNYTTLTITKTKSGSCCVLKWSHKMTQITEYKPLDDGNSESDL